MLDPVVRKVSLPIITAATQGESLAYASASSGPWQRYITWQLPLDFEFFFFFSSPSWCTGFTRVSEETSETVFLLVENYLVDRFSWSSDRLGIFEKKLP